MAAPSFAVDAAVSASAYKSLATLDVSRVLGPEYLPMVQDIVRMVCVQATIQLMVYLGGSSSASFFSQDFVMLIVYILLGVMLYWLAIRRVVAIV